MAKGSLESKAWRSLADDTIMVKVKEECVDSNGQPYKRGVVIKITEEQLKITAEGQEYIQQVPKEIGRWDAIIEEAEEKNEEEED